MTSQTTQTTAAYYLMDDPREAARLQLKVDGRDWASRYLRPYLTPKAEVLCAGCGPGHLLRGASDIEPSIAGTGIDLSIARLTEARQRSMDYPQLDYVSGDLQRLPLPDNMFDIAWSRHLIEYLPRKELAVAELYRVLRPGGTLLLQDLDGQFVWNYPEDAELSQTINRVMAALAPSGFDPFVGRKLYHLALNAGFTNLRVTVEPYHLYAGTIDEPHYVQWKLKLDILRPQLVKLLGRLDADDMIQRFLAYLKRDDTMTYSMLFTVTGKK